MTRRRGTLAEGIECPTCLSWAQTLDVTNRFEVSHHHGSHEPPRSQPKEHRIWEEQHPHRIQPCPLSPTGVPCVHRDRPNHGGLCADLNGHTWPDPNVGG